MTPLVTTTPSSASSSSVRSEKKLEGRTPFPRLTPKCEEVEDRKKGSLFELIHEEEEEDPSPLCELPGAILSPLPLSSVESMMTPSVSALSATSLSLFLEKMVGSLIHIHCLGEITTTFYLDQPQFANSPFFGTQITIREFTTAPKVFNIEICTAAHALLALQEGSKHLLATIRTQDLGFSLHRIECYTDSSSPLQKEEQEEDASQNNEDEES